MGKKIIENCPECGAKLEPGKTCLQMYYDLSYYTLSLQDPEFIHQLIVDAYAAQHADKTTKPIKITFALVGLYLVNVKNYTGRQVQLAHMVLAKKPKVWPKFLPPEVKTG